MTIKGLKQMHDARPFRPFVLHMTNGRRLRVQHPELLARSSTGRTAILYGSGDSFEMIDLLHVMSISVGNGRERTRRSTDER